MYKCKKCKNSFTRQSNLTRHYRKTHENNRIHHHGFQFVDSQFIKRKLYCELHLGTIKDGKIFHCFPCNYSICTECMEKDCTVCNKDICIHKVIIIEICY